MTRAGEEEKRLAVEAGDILPDGTPWITVIVDGSWGTRSHGHKYTSHGGMAAVIGLRTKKLLFYGVRNKFCIVCARTGSGEETPAHKCYRNWVGTSTAMESDIIIEGFNRSEEMHGVRFMEFIGDGDSSVYKNVLSYVSYGRDVRKVECANHVTKCYTSALYDISKQTKEAKQVLSKARITRMKICVRKMIKYRAQERVECSGEKDSSAQALSSDVKNASFHVLGHHDRCQSYYCNVVSGSVASPPPQIEISANLKIALLKAADIVCNKSRSLVIYDVTSNLAENLMSQVAKTLGGKRVNHYQKRGYRNRCAAAALAFSSGSQMHIDVFKHKYQRSPTKIMKKYVTVAQKKQLARPKDPAKRVGRYVRRSLAGTDGDYGPACAAPDMEERDVQLFQQKTKQFLDSLGNTAMERSEITRSTIDRQGTVASRAAQTRHSYKFPSNSKHARFNLQQKYHEQASVRHQQRPRHTRSAIWSRS